MKLEAELSEADRRIRAAADHLVYAAAIELRDVEKGALDPRVGAARALTLLETAQTLYSDVFR